MQRSQNFASAVLFALICGAAAVALAPIAAAAPECTNVGPTTTQCQTNGSSQIVTSPQVLTPDYWGYPWGGGLVISLGGLGW